MRYVKEIVVEITREDAMKAGEFSDQRNCLLATAILRQLNPDKEFRVGWCYVYFNVHGRSREKVYEMDFNEAVRIDRCYTKYGKRIRAGFKPFKVTLCRRAW